MNFSKRVSSVQPSATLAINAKAQEMRASGENVVSLAVGEPDFSTPAHIIQAAKAALDQGFTRYTAVPGIPELRQAVAGYFSKSYAIDCRFDEVMVSNGGKQCLYNILQALIDPGDEVLVPGPYWVSYPAMVQLAQGVPVVVPTEPEDGFLVSPDKLDKYVTPRTRVLILNTPSNPTGCHYDQKSLDQLADWAVSRDIFVISDEIYDQLVYEPAEPASLCGFWAKNKEKVAVVNGLSKTFAMTGWRIGYVLAHVDLIRAMSKIQGQSTSNICSIAQKGALAALTGPFEFVEEMKKAFVSRRDLALDMIGSWKDSFCPRPDGAFYVFPRLDTFYRGEVDNSTRLCQLILEQEKIALVPGAAFGDDRCIRISYAVSEKVLEKCLARIGKLLAKM
ncbi:pyridoxal phosphate-dependent aminotransferase [Desulfonatronovibrio hydrogenovorans]|uniref:pyridoxal phosphate-dependent aminotransferase n=1 Tax=Desulfonatronovibrio hydrogenovorans TaxID=53245 RepID=UPI00048F2696|nr:pyridoxal phosphate-dependent aminotransferase [Desulfonatronovibrio hydrogenovorans]